MNLKDQCNNLQELLAFMPGRDEIEVLERKLLIAADGYDNITFVQAFISLAACILASRPDTKENTMAQAKLVATVLVAQVEMLIERIEK